jgi:hypothetical protein
MSGSLALSVSNDLTGNLYTAGGDTATGAGDDDYAILDSARIDSSHDAAFSLGKWAMMQNDITI